MRGDRKSFAFNISKLGSGLIAQVFPLAAASFQSTTGTMNRQRRESSIQQGRLSLDLSVPSMRTDASWKKIKNEKILD